MGRTLSVRKDVGAMSTTEYTEYDLLGRVVRSVDLLGRVTTTEYSADGLTSTVTSPAGATFITVQNTDGSTARIAGSGQREELTYMTLTVTMNELPLNWQMMLFWGKALPMVSSRRLCKPFPIR